MSYSSTVVIAELTSKSGSTPRVVTLVGPSLPFMETEWSGENQLVTTWYPGNPDEATQQNLGPREMPSTWRGDWRRTMMGGTPTPYVDDTGSLNQLIDPSILRDTLEDMFRAGRRLRVTWSTQQQPDGTATPGYPIQGSIVREGRVKTWKFTHRTIHDIQWEFTFEWMSRGAGSQVPRVTSTRDNTLPKTSAPYVAAIQNLIDAAQAAQDASLLPDAQTLGQLESVATAPVDAMTALATATVQLQDDIVSIAGIGTSLATQPIQVAQMALNHAADALAQAQDTYQDFSLIPAELMTSNTDAVSVMQAYAIFGPLQDAAQQAEIQAYIFYQAMRAAVPTQSPALSGRNSAAGSPNPQQTIVTVYLARDGDTPQRISQRYYGTPDHAADILRANGLSWHTNSFAKGKQLVIPVIPSSTQSV